MCPFLLSFCPSPCFVSPSLLMISRSPPPILLRVSSCLKEGFSVPLLLVSQILDFSKVPGDNLDFNRQHPDCVKMNLFNICKKSIG